MCLLEDDDPKHRAVFKKQVFLFKDSPQGQPPGTANRQPLATANHRQPRAAANCHQTINFQPPTFEIEKVP